MNDQELGTATGFVVGGNTQNFLITNWHVLAGRNPETDQPVSSTGGLPDEVHIFHHAAHRLGVWIEKSESLYAEDGSPNWLEHASGKAVDVVALPLSNTGSDIKLYPFDLQLADSDMVPQPAMPVSIIGFPFGLTSGGVFPIWKTGHIASDPDLDYHKTPAFLIDATTRGGMSGSPVVLRLSGGFKTASGNMILAGGMTTKFLGVYSGRIHKDSEIGRVWRANLVREIIDA